MDWALSDVVRFDLGPLLQGETRIAKLKGAYNLLILGLRGLQCKTILKQSKTILKQNHGLEIF